MSFAPLAELYSDVVSRRGVAYHASAIAADEIELTVSAELPAEIDPTLREAGAAHLAAMLEAGRKLHDGPVVVFDRADRGQITGRVGTYFDMIATCDSLAAEYLRAPEGSRLPLRERAHQLAGGDPLSAGAGRAAAIGVSVAAIVPSAHGEAVALGRRRHDLAVEPGTWHVVPSGVIESWGDDAVVETVAEELREELDVELGEGEIRARLEPLGIGFDLMRLRPDLCFRLSLDGEVSTTSEEFDATEVVPLTRAGLVAFWESHPPEALTPPAVAAIALLETRISGP